MAREIGRTAEAGQVVRVTGRDGLGSPLRRRANPPKETAMSFGLGFGGVILLVLAGLVISSFRVLRE